MDKQEFKQRAILAALPEIFRRVRNNPVEDILEPTAEIVIEFADTLMKRLYKEPDKKFLISDARAGDILSCGTIRPFIYNGYHDDHSVGAYCGLNIEGNFSVPIIQQQWTTIGEVISFADYVQINALFLKMHEAGYVWDPDKKELYLSRMPLPEQKPISDETREEMIKRYRDMMKANEGKSFEERRDAINNFRAGR